MMIISVLVIACILFLILLKEIRLKRRNIEMLKLCIGVMEADDPGLKGHTYLVTGLVMLFYDFLPFRIRIGISRDWLECAAILSDLGMMGIPSQVRNKQGKYDDKDWHLVRNYPEIGVRLMKTMEGLDPIYDWVRYQHERIDGRGYYGLKKDEIPVGARILSIANTFAAITMPRNYRPTLNYDEAVNELRIVAGSQLDEELVECFCSIPLNRIKEHMEKMRKTLDSYSEAIALEKTDAK